MKLLLSVFQADDTANFAFFFLSTHFRQVIVGKQTEESSSNGEQPHCSDLSSSYSVVVASETPTSLSDETDTHGRM